LIFKILKWDNVSQVLNVILSKVAAVSGTRVYYTPHTAVEPILYDTICRP